MDNYLLALLLALLPALGTVVGAVLAEAVTISKRTLSLALHGAAGVAIAVVAVELMPQALAADPPWAIILAFVAGGGFYVVMDGATGLLEERVSGARGDRSPSASAASVSAWLIFLAVSVDLFSDGIMVGTGSTLSFGLGLLLSLAQVPANIPGGFATIATFKRNGVGRARRLLLAAGFAVPILLGATLGYWGVRGQPDLVKFLLLSFTAGILATVVVEEIAPSADDYADIRAGALSFVGGFALFAFLSTYFG